MSTPWLLICVSEIREKIVDLMTIRRAVRPFEISNRSLHEVRGSTERLPHRH